jgi:hypothetical protein
MAGSRFVVGALAITLLMGAPAFAGGATGGGPIEDPGDTPPVDDGGPTPGDGSPGGGGGPTPSSGYTAAAGANVFDLENFTPAPPGGYNVFDFGQSASQTVGGLTLSLTPAAGIRLALGDESPFSYLGVPVDVVGRQSAFDFGFGASTGFIFANFSEKVSVFSLMAYKIAADYMPSVTLTAYSGLNGTGSVLGTTTGSFGGLNYQTATLALDGLAGARSIGFNANTRGNVWFDNFSATAGGVPEPASWAMLIAGFGLVGATMRRRSARTA